MNDEPTKLASDLQKFLKDRELLVKKASVTNEELLKKIASTEEENRILRETLELVSRGVIDPLDAKDRVEEFRGDPQQLEVIKAAYELGLQSVPAIGSPVTELGPDRDKVDPLTEALIDLEPTIRRKW
jgi:predicted DNA binding protein